VTASTSTGDDEPTGIWLRDQPDEDGTYHLSIEISPDDEAPLDADTAYRWAREVLSAVAQAEYGAAVVRQAGELGLDDVDAAHLLNALREVHAGQTPVTMLRGLSVVPGVSASTREPFLHLRRDGKTTAQWTPDDARRHALDVVEGVETAALDTAYRQVLEDRVGLDRLKAMVMVEHLGHPEEQEDPT
jgi:hypothetical protein